MIVKQNVSIFEIAMTFVLLVIVAVVAIPSFDMMEKTNTSSDVQILVSVQKVRTAYAFAMAENGDFPVLSEIVNVIDADFASETNESTGIIFREGNSRLTVNTYRDNQCKMLTNNSKPGVSDVVRCI